ATLGMNTSLTPGYCGMGASTPTTWWTLSFMVKVLPTTSGSPRYARCQYSYVRTRTGAAPCTSSSATNVLPSSGRTPKASKKFAETTAVETRCASARSEEHTSELQSPYDLVCRLLLEKKKNKIQRKSKLT